MSKFKITDKMIPAGDQIKSIDSLCKGLNDNKKNQVLLGITGSGKTFTVANVIMKHNKPALIIAPNKTLASQLYYEFKEIFPDNSVQYFVSYYNYYRPEAYIPTADRYIEQQSIINLEIEKMRNSTIRSLVEREDTIVIASVSCIYGICSPVQYINSLLNLHINEKFNQSDLILHLIRVGYTRALSFQVQEGEFSVTGDNVMIYSTMDDIKMLKIRFDLDVIEYIAILNDKHEEIKRIDQVTIYPTNIFTAADSVISNAVDNIKKDLKDRLDQLHKEGRELEANRLSKRVIHDIDLLSKTGRCKGIENYSRYLTNRDEGQPPYTLMSFFQENGLIVVDESHITIPQIKAMYNADFERKKTLVHYGFRLPSCHDNRPLRFEEWDKIRNQTLFVSATPSQFEIDISNNIVHQIIRPTGLLDPECIVLPNENTLEVAIEEIRKEIQRGGKIMLLAYTKKISEHLSARLNKININAEYIHSDIKTLRRVEILRSLRDGDLDVVIGINLLREGIDIPTVSLVIILEADREGYLRSTTSLIQIIGRAARNSEGRVILFANRITSSMKEALDITKERRDKQDSYNKKHNITPKSVNLVKKPANEKTIEELEFEMLNAASVYDFETAGELKLKIKRLKEINKK